MHSAILADDQPPHETGTRCLYRCAYGAIATLDDLRAFQDEVSRAGFSSCGGIRLLLFDRGLTTYLVTVGMNLGLTSYPDGRWFLSAADNRLEPSIAGRYDANTRTLYDVYALIGSENLKREILVDKEDLLTEDGVFNPVEDPPNSEGGRQDPTD